MNTFIENPENIYQKLENESDKILTKIREFDGSDKNIDDIKNEILKFVENTKHKISVGVNELKESSEWKTFIVAFYGETNAGKSTIIESLRILLNEKTKVKEIKKFREFEQENNITAEDYNKIENDISLCKKVIEDLTIENKKIGNEFLEKEHQIALQMEELVKIINEKKSELSKFQKLLYFIGLKKINEEYQYKTLKKEIKQLTADKKTKIENIDSRLKLENSKLFNLHNKHEEILKKLEKLIELSDGKIIGDGRSDFTKHNHIYEFEYDNTKLNLIDVPGIEGSEKQVEEVIWQAVRKAHAVFYVTNKAARPQTGDKSKKGTLEKIKEHLGIQTEVLTLFNRSITNPRQLNMPMMNSDEKAGIDDLDKTMKNLFDNRYCGSICLSALPAFLSLSECLVPGTDRYKQKNKFFEKYSKADILTFSNINSVKIKLEDIARNFPNKIRRANCYKAFCVLTDVREYIKDLFDKKIEPEYEQLNEYIDNTNKQIDDSVRKLKHDLKNNAYECIYNFRENVAKKTYDYIDSDVNNKEFASRFKTYLEEGQNALIKNLEYSIKNDIDKFTNDIKKIISGLQERVNEFVALNKEKHIEGFDTFDLDIDIKLNIDIAGIAGTLVSLAAAIWAALSFLATGGIFAIIGAVLGILGSLVAFGKKIYAFMNHRYRMSQQKRTVDDNLSKVESGVQENIDNYIKRTITPEVEKNIEKIKIDIRLPIEKMQKIKLIITDVGNNLSKIEASFEDAAV